jgi:hypothetical protein
MTEVLPPPADSTSLAPHTPQPSNTSNTPQPRQPRERVTSYAQNRMSQYSRSSQRSRPQSTALEYPAFNSSLSYTTVRDFAYEVFHPLHYGAPPEPEPSGSSTPGSEWNAGRRQSDPMDQWNSGSGGWTAGPWGGDGVMYGDPENDASLAALPSTSFGSGDGSELGDDDHQFKKSKHRKSKSYADISDFERGRRRESGRKSRDANYGMMLFNSQQSDPAGRESLRQSRGYSNETGQRRDSRNPTTLPNRSFHRSFDPDEHIPLDTEPHATRSPVRNSMGPEDEELFAGPSLALYSFEPENANELRLVEGQEIMVSYRHGQGWLVASDPHTDEQGLVPEAYVRLIADMPNYDPATGQFMDIDDMEDSEMTNDSEHQTNDSNELNREYNMDDAFEENRAAEAAERANQDPNDEKYRKTVLDDDGVVDLNAAAAVSNSPVDTEDDETDPRVWTENTRLKRIARTGKD